MGKIVGCRRRGFCEVGDMFFLLEMMIFIELCSILWIMKMTIPSLILRFHFFHREMMCNWRLLILDYMYSGTIRPFTCNLKVLGRMQSGTQIQSIEQVLCLSMLTSNLTLLPSLSIFKTAWASMNNTPFLLKLKLLRLLRFLKMIISCTWGEVWSSWLQTLLLTSRLLNVKAP